MLIFFSRACYNNLSIASIMPFRVTGRKQATNTRAKKRSKRNNLKKNLKKKKKSLIKIRNVRKQSLRNHQQLKNRGGNKKLVLHNQGSIDEQGRPSSRTEFCTSTEVLSLFRMLYSKEKLTCVKSEVEVCLFVGPNSVRKCDNACSARNSSLMLKFYKEHNMQKATVDHVQRLLSQNTVAKLKEDLVNKYGNAPELEAVVNLYHIGDAINVDVTHDVDAKQLAAIDAGGLTNFTMGVDELNEYTAIQFDESQETVAAVRAGTHKSKTASILEQWLNRMRKEVREKLEADTVWMREARIAIKRLYYAFNSFTLYTFTPKYSTHWEWIVPNEVIVSFASDNLLYDIEFESALGSLGHMGELLDRAASHHMSHYTALFDKEGNGNWRLCTNINKYHRIANYKTSEEKAGEPVPELFNLPLHSETVPLRSTDGDTTKRVHNANGSKYVDDDPGHTFMMAAIGR